jgi:pyruvate formate lyase activating enzyme
VAVTAGYIEPEARRDFFRVIDAANVDLKAFTDRFYRKLCFAEIEPVKDTLRFLKEETDVWVEVTTLLIPGENDGEEEIDRLCEWFVQTLGPDVPLHLTAFHPDFKTRDKPRTPGTTLARARAQALRHGLVHVYTGNVHDERGQSTYCAGCSGRVIQRNWYEVGEYRLDEEGRCLDCGRPLAGRFGSGPGSWGARRLRVRIGS